MTPKTLCNCIATHKEMQMLRTSSEPFMNDPKVEMTFAWAPKIWFSFATDVMSSATQHCIVCPSFTAVILSIINILHVLYFVLFVCILQWPVVPRK